MLTNFADLGEDSAWFTASQLKTMYNNKKRSLETEKNHLDTLKNLIKEKNTSALENYEKFKKLMEKATLFLIEARKEDEQITPLKTQVERIEQEYFAELNKVFNVIQVLNSAQLAYEPIDYPVHLCHDITNEVKEAPVLDKEVSIKATLLNIWRV